VRAGPLIAAALTVGFKAENRKGATYLNITKKLEILKEITIG
jgi:hypothetical protein